MCLLAAVAAAIGWWSRYLATHRAAEFWGPEATALLRGPSQVELLELAGSVESANLPASERADATRKFAGRYVVARHDISAAHGLTHLRSALVEDRNFNWNLPAPGKAPVWVWALRFQARGHGAMLLFPSDFSRLGCLHGDKLPADHQAIVSISCRPLMKPLATYFRALETAWK